MSALDRADQAAWEAPELRPTFVPDGEEEVWFDECPEWCEGNHLIEEQPRHGRWHRSAPLRVRCDWGKAYPTTREGDLGMCAANLNVRLARKSRTNDAMIELIYFEGHPDDGQLSGDWAGRYYSDEVRELIAVLQHLLKVGMDD